MSKFNAPTPRPTPVPPIKTPASKAPVKSEVRNSPIPKVATATARPAATAANAIRHVTHEAIAQRAYFIWKTSGGSEFENWIKAERELRAGK